MAYMYADRSVRFDLKSDQKNKTNSSGVRAHDPGPQLLMERPAIPLDSGPLGAEDGALPCVPQGRDTSQEDVEGSPRTYPES